MGEEEAEDHQGPTQPHLAKQDATTVDPSKLTALTPEVVRSAVWSIWCCIVLEWRCLAWSVV